MIQINIMHVNDTFKKIRFNMIKDTCLFPIVVVQSLLARGPKDSCTGGLLINATLKRQVMQEH
jgi:hypothetical protein